MWKFRKTNFKSQREIESRGTMESLWVAKRGHNDIFLNDKMGVQYQQRHNANKVSNDNKGVDIFFNKWKT